MPILILSSSTSSRLQLSRIHPRPPSQHPIHRSRKLPQALRRNLLVPARAIHLAGRMWTDTNAFGTSSMMSLVVLSGDSCMTAVWVWRWIIAATAKLLIRTPESRSEYVWFTFRREGVSRYRQCNCKFWIGPFIFRVGVIKVKFDVN